MVTINRGTFIYCTKILTIPNLNNFPYFLIVFKQSDSLKKDVFKLSVTRTLCKTASYYVLVEYSTNFWQGLADNGTYAYKMCDVLITY